jgi:hypothetical protein
MVHAGGRPRTTVPESEEIIELGKDLVEWASTEVEGELRCRWCEWYSIKHFMLRKVWKRLVDTPEFRPYYEIAQGLLGKRWIDGSIHQSIAQRYLRVYDAELRESEDFDLTNKVRLEAEAKKSNDENKITYEKEKLLETESLLRKARLRLSEMGVDVYTVQITEN